MQHLRFTVLAALLLVPQTAGASITPTAPDLGAAAYRNAGPWSVTSLVGIHDDTPFLHILSFRGGNIKPSYIGGLILGRTITTWRDDWVWEWEAQVFQHSGLQSNAEANAAIVLHWTRFPWDEGLDTTVSFGQGMSLATERPPIEDETRALLHYMHAEIAFRPPAWKQISIVTRLHHRSGAFGLYGVSGGSNFLTAGLRYRF